MPTKNILVELSRYRIDAFAKKWNMISELHPPIGTIVTKNTAGTTRTPDTRFRNSKDNMLQGRAEAVGVLYSLVHHICRYYPVSIVLSSWSAECLQIS